MGNSSTIADLPAFLWEVPEKPVSIYLHYDVIDRMSPEVMRGLAALKRRGAEVGGLLLGRWEPGSPQNIVIEDFEPIASEYLNGPSYNLSPNDLVAFENALSRRRPDGKIVVGFFRSHTRDGLFMADSDIALANRYFQDAVKVFLLVRPFATRTSIGGFFIWENGEINRESSYQQFPFNRMELAGNGFPSVPPPRSTAGSHPSAVPQKLKTERPDLMALQQLQIKQQAEREKQQRQAPPPPKVEPPRIETPSRLFVPASEPVIEREPVAEREPAVQRAVEREPVVQREPERVPPTEIPVFQQEAPASIFSYEEDIPEGQSWRWLLVPAFICVAVIAAYFGYRSLSSSKSPVAIQPPVQTVLPLKLSVAEKDDQLEVTWDRNAASIALAQRGVLTIVDGANKRDLTLTSAQLKNGSVRYRRLSGDVGLRLEIFPQGLDAVSESIRIVLSDPNSPSAPARSTVTASDPPKPEPTPEATQTVTPPPPPATAKAETPKAETPKAEVAKTAPPKQEPPKVEPPKTQAVTAAPPKPEAPKSAPPATVAKSTPSTEKAPITPVKPPTAAPPASQPVARKSTPRVTPPVVTQPAAQTPPPVAPPVETPPAAPPEVELQRPERRR